MTSLIPSIEEVAAMHRQDFERARERAIQQIKDVKLGYAVEDTLTNLCLRAADAGDLANYVFLATHIGSIKNERDNAVAELAKLKG